LPGWINQYITEAHSNLSTDMGINLAKKFIRGISQPFDHTQTGISLWALEDVEREQRKRQVETERQLEEAGPEALAALGGLQAENDYRNGAKDIELDGVHDMRGGFDGDGDGDEEMEFDTIGDEALAALDMPDMAARDRPDL
jgi:hypothetical protein